MMHGAHVLKVSQKVDWWSFAWAARGPLDSRVLEMVPIIEC